VSRWTPEHDALLRKACARAHARRRRRVDWAALAEATGHSVCAVRCRVHRLGLVRPGRQWSAEEDAFIVREWAELSPRVLRAHLPGRTTYAIARRARVLGLGLAERAQGLMPIYKAAERAGYGKSAFVALLVRQGVPTCRIGVQRTHGTARPWRHVDWEDVVRAVERDTKLESARDAANRLGVSQWAVLQRLRSAGHALEQRRRVRLPPEVIDRAMAQVAA